MKLCTKFERNRAIRGGVIAISVLDLMTLNIALRVTLGSGIISRCDITGSPSWQPIGRRRRIFTKFDFRELIRA